MEILMAILLIILIIILIIIYIVVSKIKRFAERTYGISNIEQLEGLIELSELEEANTPKSITGMESIYLPKIEKDFPELNVNELKRICEKFIIEFFESCDDRNIISDTNYMSDKVIALFKTRINDYKEKNIHFNSIKIHRTALESYMKKDGKATIVFNSSLEYYTTEGEESGKKVQDRIKTEFIYVIDNKKVGNIKKSVGLNCPNCGAPIKKIGHKTCDYCGAGVVDIVKKNWILNNLTQY